MVAYSKFHCKAIRSKNSIETCKKKFKCAILSASLFAEWFKNELSKKGHFMTKEVVKHRKDEKKKPTLTAKERKVKKQEKKQSK
jgi:hypothetical protein